MGKNLGPTHPRLFSVRVPNKRLTKAVLIRVAMIGVSERLLESIEKTERREVRKEKFKVKSAIGCGTRRWAKA